MKQINTSLQQPSFPIVDDFAKQSVLMNIHKCTIELINVIYGP